ALSSVNPAVLSFSLWQVTQYWSRTARDDRACARAFTWPAVSIRMQRYIKEDRRIVYFSDSASDTCKRKETTSIGLVKGPTDASSPGSFLETLSLHHQVHISLRLLQPALADLFRQSRKFADECGRFGSRVCGADFLRGSDRLIGPLQYILQCRRYD